MTQSSPSRSTAHFIAKILSAHTVPVSAVGETIRSIDAVLRDLAAGGTSPVAEAGLRSAATKPQPAAKRGRPRKITGAIAVQAVRQLADKPKRGRPPAAQAADVAPRKRGRKPLYAAPIAIEPEAAEDAALVVAARLVRRTSLVHENEVPAFLQSHPARGEATRLRGVVKWFDGRTNKGALRLTGISGDVMIEPAILTQSGVKRLYKDQEIEAEISQASGKPLLTALHLPGWAAPAVTFGQAAGSAGTRVVTRQARPVVVEIKRDSGKQRRDRDRAEQIFSSDE